jgi:hypothetical protein
MSIAEVEPGGDEALQHVTLRDNVGQQRAGTIAMVAAAISGPQLVRSRG